MNDDLLRPVEELGNLEDYTDPENLPSVRFKPRHKDRAIELSRLGNLICSSKSQKTNGVEKTRIDIFRRYSFLDFEQFRTLWKKSIGFAKEITSNLVTVNFDGVTLINEASKDLNMLELVLESMNNMDLNTLDDQVSQNELLLIKDLLNY